MASFIYVFLLKIISICTLYFSSRIISPSPLFLNNNNDKVSRNYWFFCRGFQKLEIFKFIPSINLCWGHDMSKKNRARSFWRFRDTNGQTDKQSLYIYRWIYLMFSTWYLHVIWLFIFFRSKYNYVFVISAK